VIERLKKYARLLKNETIALYHSAKDPRTPWYAKALVFLVVAYSLSPIDLIPDFIPVLGYLDDLIIIPLGIALAIRMIPPEVLAEARRTADQHQGPQRSVRYIGLTLIVLIWIVILGISIRFLLNGRLDQFR
jgi:uncharacterized membrane protein YkvA (DUF1232 family)